MTRALLVAAIITTTATEARAADFVCPNPTADREHVARKVFEQGVELEASDPRAALARYTCASTIADRAVIELRIGVVAERLQLNETAIHAFTRYLELAGSAAPDAATMRQHIQELSSAPTPPSPPPPKEPPPPPHGSEAPRPVPERPPSAPDRTATYIGWGLVALGGVLGLTGGGFLFDAKSKSDSVQSLPNGTSWASDDARGTYDASRRSQTIGIVCLVAAPIAVAVGVVTLLRAGR